MATIKDVALHAGVSVATVSYILNGSKKVSLEVTERVLLAVKEVSYHPNRSAQTLRSGKSKTIRSAFARHHQSVFPSTCPSY